MAEMLLLLFYGESLWGELARFRPVGFSGRFW